MKTAFRYVTVLIAFSARCLLAQQDTPPNESPAVEEVSAVAAAQPIANTEATEDTDCNAEPLIGLCKARIPRYFYNSSSQACEVFYYGGCGGNTNNFVDVESCQFVCGSKSTEKAPDQGIKSANDGSNADNKNLPIDSHATSVPNQFSLSAIASSLFIMQLLSY